jgi:metal-sulfur cluster biosynthetic enzyme
VVVGGSVVGYLGYIHSKMSGGRKDKKMTALERLVWDALKEVNDPELGVSIVGLGLVYAVKIKEQVVEVKMSLTSMGCPLFETIEKEMIAKTERVKGVKKVKVKLVWDPPWHKGMMDEEVKAELGIE